MSSGPTRVSPIAGLALLCGGAGRAAGLGCSGGTPSSRLSFPAAFRDPNALPSPCPFKPHRGSLLDLWGFADVEKAARPLPQQRSFRVSVSGDSGLGSGLCQVAQGSGPVGSCGPRVNLVGSGQPWYEFRRWELGLPAQLSCPVSWLKHCVGCGVMFQPDGPVGLCVLLGGSGLGHSDCAQGSLWALCSGSLLAVLRDHSGLYI